MLTEWPVHAAIPASDIERAKRFYRDTLGFKVAEEAKEGVRFDCGGTQFYIYPTAAAGQAAHTLASWRVKDPKAEMADLRARGVKLRNMTSPASRP